MTVIVMLVLAGVSLNALVGDNGIIRQAMNASWLNEMTAVQEAFEQWKVQYYDDDLIPTNGIVSASEILNNGRLYGEIAYYRLWSENGTMPETDVKLNNEVFNNEYSGDLTIFPRAGTEIIEDLYFLDNDGIGIKSDKKYIIDALNSMIYSVNGHNINDVTVHSIPMYKLVSGGDRFIRICSCRN